MTNVEPKRPPIKIVPCSTCGQRVWHEPDGTIVPCAERQYTSSEAGIKTRDRLLLRARNDLKDMTNQNWRTIRRGIVAYLGEHRSNHGLPLAVVLPDEPAAQIGEALEDGGEVSDYDEALRSCLHEWQSAGFAPNGTLYLFCRHCSEVHQN